MKKIVICANSLWNIYNFRYELVKSLSEDYKIIIVSGYDNTLIDKFDKRVSFKFFHISNRSKGILSNIKTFFSLYYALKKIKPDYFLAFTIKPNIYGSIISSYLNIKIINNITGLGNIFIKKNFFNYIGIKLYKFALKKSLFIYFHNNSDKQLFINKKITSSFNSFVIPGSGINLSQFKFSNHRIAIKDNLNFVYFGRIITDKGILILFEAIKEINIILPNNKFFFNFIGELDKKDENYQKFLELFNNIPNVKYYKKIDDIKEKLEFMDCVILPSKREGMPRSLLEASALGLPIIASNVAGCKHIIEDNKNGLLFNDLDYNNLSKKIIFFYKMNYNEKLNLILNARDKIEKEYNVKNIIRIYREALMKSD